MNAYGLSGAVGNTHFMNADAGGRPLTDIIQFFIDVPEPPA